VFWNNKHLPEPPSIRNRHPDFDNQNRPFHQKINSLDKQQVCHRPAFAIASAGRPDCT